MVSAFISGWQVSGIYTYQSGFPLAFGNIIFTGDLNDIPLPASERTVARWFNTDAGFNKSVGGATRVQRADVPAAAGERPIRIR